MIAFSQQFRADEACFEVVTEAEVEWSGGLPVYGQPRWRVAKADEPLRFRLTGAEGTVTEWIPVSMEARLRGGYTFMQGV